jgi:hypothetical protein
MELKLLKLNHIGYGNVISNCLHGGPELLEILSEKTAGYSLVCV